MISYEHSFVYAAVPKTGTRAILAALKAPADNQEHLTLRQARQFMRPEDFANFFKFTFVRNPFDRFISYCAYKEPEFVNHPRSVMRRFVNDPPFDDILFRPQCLFVLGAQGEMLPDYIGRFEQLQASFDHIAERISIPATKLTPFNGSLHEEYCSYYNPELTDAVARLYVRDFELFGYDYKDTQK